MENNIEIFFDDLSEKKQQEIIEKLGNNGNYDVFAIAAITIGEDEPGYIPENAAEDEKDAIQSARHPLQVYIENLHDERIGGFTMPLPATMEDLRPFLDGAEITGWQDIKIWEARSNIKGLGEAVTAAMQKTMSPDTLDELNYLAAKIEGLINDEHELFSAAVSANRHCGSLTELINLVDNLGNFDIQPAFNAAMLGEHLIDMEADKYAFEKLYVSKDEELRGLIDYIEYLEKHPDYPAYGREFAESDQGVFIENGYLSEYGKFQETYRGPRDIPAEYRLFSQPDEIIRPLVKVEGINIAAALVKLRAVCGSRVSEAAGDLNSLAEGQGSDYLLMINKSNVHFSQAADAYKRGCVTNTMLEQAAHNPDMRVFAVGVSERGDDGRGVTGDLVELNGTALRSNITRHAVVPDRMDIVQADGSAQSHDMLAWADIPADFRVQFQEVTPHYPEKAVLDAKNHFVLFAGANKTACKASDMSTLLTDIAAFYMSVAENPQPDMIRVTNEAAKEILARGDASVYNLTATGPEELAPIDAARITNFRDLAIRCDDIAGLDKWAERTVKNMARQNERGERPKNKAEEL